MALKQIIWEHSLLYNDSKFYNISHLFWDPKNHSSFFWSNAKLPHHNTTVKSALTSKATVTLGWASQFWYLGWFGKMPFQPSSQISLSTSQNNYVPSPRTSPQQKEQRLQTEDEAVLTVKSSSFSCSNCPIKPCHLVLCNNEART